MQTIRQSELFASKDWQVLYQAFTTVNFNASDPTSINQSLRAYIAANYPEDFNDWIESSEFVAIIDLLSWLAGTLAFKTDINAHENFLETAQARESILRLARFLSYNARRNQPATGMLKIMSVSSDSDISDSTGTSLSGVTITWNDPDNPDWFEQFTTVMNDAFVNTNQFGSALKSITYNNITSNLYRINGPMGLNNMAFSSPVGGTSMNFELCNGDFTSLGAFTEQTPDANAAINFYYRNDGNGYGSARTGFFFLFKQGSTMKQDFLINYPVENQILDLTSSGVTQEDIWVQSVSDAGDILLDWTPVPAIFSANITYNPLTNTNRNIFSTISRDQDLASIRFSDGIFGNAPAGNIRVWYRVANGLIYQIKPADLNGIVTTLSYYNKAGVLSHLTVKLALQETVSNSTPRETDAQIAARAPSVYATQNRMVSGEDYNTFPISANLSAKMKAVNRIYSGHSRYVDLNDPTSTYTDVVVTADDGMMYTEQSNIYEEIPLTLNLTASDLVNSTIGGILTNPNVERYVFNDILTRVSENAPLPSIQIANLTTWNQVSSAKFSSSGWFSRDNNYFTVGNLLQFRLPNGDLTWATVSSLTGLPRTSSPSAGVSGPVTLSRNIVSGSVVTKIIPGYVSSLSTTVNAALTARFANTSDLRGFSLWYDPGAANWVIRDELTALNTPSSPTDIIHVLTMEYFSGLMWRVSARGLKMIFESARKVKWYYDASDPAIDLTTGETKIDTVTVLKSNPDLLSSTGAGITNDRVFKLTNLYYYNDGSQEPRRSVIDYSDFDENGSPDDPESFNSLVELPEQQSTLFWQLGESFGQSSYLPIYNINVFTKPASSIADVPNSIRTRAQAPNDTIAFNNGDIVYMLTLDTFYQRANNAWVAQPRLNFRIATGRGPNTAQRWMVLASDQTGVGSGDPFVIMYSTNPLEVAAQGLPSSTYLIQDGSLTFKWKHFTASDHRIDPAITNIVDIFMLTSAYDYAVRLWITNGATLDSIPVPPTELDLRIIMQDYENYKMFSDTIVWRPVRYKYLFGSAAQDINLQATFKVVKLPGATLADGQIKANVIKAINQFFDISLWDFGETFYYTELSAYVHQQLAGQIASIVLVPMSADSNFGDGFEIKCRSDEIFISTAQVTDVQIIKSNTSTNLRIG